MLDLQIAYSGLNASQVAMETIANNIANASTPGYHRQSVQLQDRPPVQIQNLLQGTGVDVAGIQRMRQHIVEGALTANISERGAAGAALDVLRQIEALLTPGDGSLPNRLQSFFDELTKLSARPDDALQRQTVLRQAVAMTDQVRSVMEGLAQLRGDLFAEAQTLVKQVNQDAEEVGQLNQQIASAQGRGFVPNDLLDCRDQLVNQLAEVVDPVVVQQGAGHDVVLLGQNSLLIGHEPISLAVQTDKAGNLAVVQDGSSEPVKFGGGKLAALLAGHNEVIGHCENQLQSFAAALQASLDHAQATGLGLSGPLNVMLGQRQVADVAAPLANSVSDFPLRAGTLAVSVTNQATGARRTAAITIDPATQSLEDVASALSGVAHLQAIVDSQSRTLSIRAESGYAFDFAGRPETTPDATGVTGTSRASLGGTYAGTAGDQFTFRALGHGTVGVTAGLAVEVRRANGDLVTTLNVGQGYEAEGALPVADGITVSFQPGTLNANDTFASPVVADADPTGILAALGLHTFFVGHDATIRVNPLLLDSPEQLATSRSSAPGDISNLTRMLHIRDAKPLEQGSQTLEQYLANLIASVGAQVHDAQSVSDHVQALGQQLEAECDNYSGVDPNQEMIQLLQFQRAFQAASKLITITDDMTKELLNAIG